MTKKIWPLKALLIICVISLLLPIMGCNSAESTRLQTTPAIPAAYATTTPTQTQTALPTVNPVLNDRVVLAEIFTKEK
jgi:hypothetical protein